MERISATGLGALKGSSPVINWLSMTPKEKMSAR